MSRPAPRSRAHYRHMRRLDMRFGDNDVFGHVNNAVYYGWFDSVLNSLLLDEKLYEIGVSDEIAYIVESSCRYLKPLAYPGRVEIGLTLASLGRSSLRWHLAAFEPDGSEASAEGELTQVCVSRATGRPIAVPARWRSVLSDTLVQGDM